MKRQWQLTVNNGLAICLLLFFGCVVAGCMREPENLQPRPDPSSLSRTRAGTDYGRYVCSSYYLEFNGPITLQDLGCNTEEELYDLWGINELPDVIVDVVPNWFHEQALEQCVMCYIDNITSWEYGYPGDCSFRVDFHADDVHYRDVGALQEEFVSSLSFLYWVVGWTLTCEGEFTFTTGPGGDPNILPDPPDPPEPPDPPAADVPAKQDLKDLADRLPANNPIKKMLEKAMNNTDFKFAEKNTLKQIEIDYKTLNGKTNVIRTVNYNSDYWNGVSDMGRNLMLLHEFGHPVMTDLGLAANGIIHHNAMVNNADFQAAIQTLYPGYTEQEYRWMAYSYCADTDAVKDLSPEERNKMGNFLVDNKIIIPTYK